MKTNQHGISLPKFLSVLTIIMLISITAMRCTPAWIEHAAVDRAVKKMESSGDTSGAALRSMFVSAATIADIHSIKFEDLKITRHGSTASISYSYETRVKITDTISLAFLFSNEEN